MAELALDIRNLAEMSIWAAARERGQVAVLHEDTWTTVKLEACPSPTGALRYFQCPRCQRRARRLFLAGPGLCCRTCGRVRHPLQRAPGSRWGREVVRPARQQQRLQERLEAGLDRNAGQRARRRRRKLLRGLEASLADRYELLWLEVLEVLDG